MILQYANHIDNTDYTLTSSTTDYNMPARNCRNPNARIPIQMNGITGQSVEIDAGSNIAWADFFVGLFIHNLTPTAVVRLQAIPSGGTYTVDGINLQLELYVDPRSPIGALYKKVTKLFSGSAGTYRKVRLWFNDPDNTDGFIRIGRPLIGQSVSTSRQFSRLWQESIEDHTIKIPLDAGGIRSHIRKQLTVLSLPFLIQDSVAKDWADLEKIRHLENTYGVDRYFFVSLFENETYHPIARSSLSFYAHFRKLATEGEVSDGAQSGVKSYTLELEEFI